MSLARRGFPASRARSGSAGAAPRGTCVTIPLLMVPVPGGGLPFLAGLFAFFLVPMLALVWLWSN